MNEEEHKFLDYIDREYEKLYKKQVRKEYTYYDQETMHDKIYSKLVIAEREHPDWINVRWTLAELTKGRFDPYDRQSIDICRMRRFALHKKNWEEYVSFRSGLKIIAMYMNGNIGKAQQILYELFNIHNSLDALFEYKDIIDGPVNEKIIKNIYDRDNKEMYVMEIIDMNEIYELLKARYS